MLALVGLYLGLSALVTSVGPAGTLTANAEAEIVGETSSLALLRNPQTRASVEDFFISWAGNTEVARAILTACEEVQVSPILAFAVAEKESRFRPRAIGINPGSVDLGLFQLNSLAYPDLSPSEAFDPYRNALLGVSHLRRVILSLGSVERGLMAYNAGVGRVVGHRIPDSTRRYTQSLVQRIEEVEGRFFRDIVATQLAARWEKTPKSLEVLLGEL